MASWVGNTVKRSNPCRHVEVVTRAVGAMCQNGLQSIPHCGKLAFAKRPALACQLCWFAIRLKS